MTNLFNANYQQYDYWYQQNKTVYHSELRALKQVMPRGGVGLEVGVGTGRFASVLGVKFGIDPCFNMLRLALKRGVITCVATGEDLPFPVASFNYLTIIISLCFVRDPVKVLQEAKRVLKKKGKIIIAIVNKDSFLGKFYRQKKSPYYQHANFFSATDLRIMLAEAGFYHFSYLQTIFKLPSQIESVQQPRPGFGEGGFIVVTAKGS